MTPERHLDIDGANNVRDLGGYPTQDGRRTRWKTFVRAASLHRLTPESQAAMLDYGIRTVIDLRRTSELEERPNVFAGSSEVVYLHQSLLNDPAVPGIDDLVQTGEPADRIVASYTSWLDRYQPRFLRTLTTLADSSSRPAVYHCAGGKDRTGMISALLLSIAGVPVEIIAEDYALSGRYLIDRFFEEQAVPGQTPESYTWKDYQRDFCPPGAMLKVLAYLDETYGGAKGFMRTVGLTTDQIEGLRAAVVE